MKEQYLDNIAFSIDDVAFTTMNICFEQPCRFIPKHSHGDKSYEIHYVPHGNGVVFACGQKYSIIPNTLYITGPGIEHEQIPDASSAMAEYCICFQVHGNRMKKGSFISLFEETKFWFGNDTQELLSILQPLFGELQNQYCGYVAHAEALLKTLIIKIVRNYTFEKDSGMRSIDLSDRKFIIADEFFLYDFRSPTLELLAERLGLGKRQTQRFLQKHYGKTFSQKLSESRQSAAVVQLTQSDKAIAAIAEELGYSSGEHFSAAFRRAYNLSPREFRKRYTLGKHIVP